MQKRFQYLARMGDLATDQMYMTAGKINLINRLSQPIDRHSEIPRQRILPARYILNDLNKRKDQIRYEPEWFIQEFENYLICLGDDSDNGVPVTERTRNGTGCRIRSIIDGYFLS